MTRVTPRPSGGFNQGIGQFNDNFGEQLDENAIQGAMAQKALSQQSTTATPANMQAAQKAIAAQSGQAAAPREIGSLADELIHRPAQSIVEGLKSFFDLNRLLEIKTDQDDAQQQAQKKQLHARYQSLTQDQQQVAKQEFQEEMQRKKQAEEEAQSKAQKEQQARSQAFSVPTGPQKGAGAPTKPREVQKMEKDRKTLAGPQSVN